MSFDHIIPILLTIIGLGIFEIVSSIDNAIINAEVLATMKPKSQRWFLFWGLLIAVFVVRGVLPWLIIWIVNPSLGPIGAITATFSNNPAVARSIQENAPILLIGGGVFLLLLFLHWLFLEEKSFGLPGEKFLAQQGAWFYALASILLVATTWFSLQVNPLLALGAVVGSSVFFITHGFKETAAQREEELMDENISDTSKKFYLEIIDATFSIDGVLGAFAFTLSMPLILIGNGIGALVVRQLTIGNIENIKKYRFLKNGAMYSVFILGLIMLTDSFGLDIPAWLSPVVTIIIVGFFYLKSIKPNSVI